MESVESVVLGVKYLVGWNPQQRKPLLACWFPYGPQSPAPCTVVLSTLHMQQQFPTAWSAFPIPSFTALCSPNYPEENHGKHIPDIFPSLKCFPCVKTLPKECLERIEKNKHLSAAKDLRNTPPAAHVYKWKAETQKTGVVCRKTHRALSQNSSVASSVCACPSHSLPIFCKHILNTWKSSPLQLAPSPHTVCVIRGQCRGQRFLGSLREALVALEGHREEGAWGGIGEEKP